MFWAFILVVVTYVLVPLVRPIFSIKLMQNHRGSLVPTALGLTFVFPTVLLIIIRGDNVSQLFSLVLLVFCLLGLVDDLLGDGNQKGFRGHFGKARISTGTVKALGGISFSLALSFQLTGGWLESISNALLISSAANFLNLLDLRPGRAGKGFLIFALPLLFLAPLIRNPLLWLAGAVLGYLPWDLQEEVMMGDTGSNALGATLGLAVALCLPQAGKIVVLVVLLGLNFLAERISFSRVIENNRVLNFLDRLGR